MARKEKQQVKQEQPEQEQLEQEQPEQEQIEQEQIEQEQPEQEQQGAWVPVDMKAEGLQTGAQYGGILEMLRNTNSRYTLVKANRRLWRGGRYRWEPQWILRDNGHEVHEVQPRAQLEVAMQEADAYISEAEAAAREIETGREQPEQLPGDMTEAQFDQIFEDEEEE